MGPGAAAAEQSGVAAASQSRARRRREAKVSVTNHSVAQAHRFMEAFRRTGLHLRSGAKVAAARGRWRMELRLRRRPGAQDYWRTRYGPQRRSGAQVYGGARAHRFTEAQERRKMNGLSRRSELSVRFPKRRSATLFK